MIVSGSTAEAFSAKAVYCKTNTHSSYQEPAQKPKKSHKEARV
jgi:hypothetical protein